ncbi:branched-chain amino acid ABC transporter permease [Futiania mangrovi]|uniref:Branched-chain amino acid ABC transporter permease n=1 Tax=Futiania mangrovi TaxID=2959716 RepID=A0A9J6P7L6_9PROT|nr:branched-chain amino acid ABC transporter permease [Futiania mangrovii]MCP1334820.1 branched-chain amino acid ABC transporter permease [Futiania mangrovii]
MLYRETGQFKTSYPKDQAIFPIAQDKAFILLVLAVAFLAVPPFINDYYAKAILIPFLSYTMAAIGLNILVGYCGQISLGTGGFMAVGAFATYKLMTSFPGLDFALIVILAGFVTAGVGALFGLPSLRIKGFYLAVATLAAQFFLVWLFNKVGWFYNYSPTGQITAPPATSFGVLVTGPEASPAAGYLFCLAFVCVFALVAKNLTRGNIGRQWMAIRDMDIAAELVGVQPLKAKLSAFAVSSFFIGMAGALYFGVWLGAAEPTEAFGINISFLVLFMIIIGGLGSILGSFLGAAFMVLLPIVLKTVMVDGMGLQAVTAKHFEILLLGVLIIFFLIVEPHGLARLWSTVKEKLRLWPFPY